MASVSTAAAPAETASEANCAPWVLVPGSAAKRSPVRASCALSVTPPTVVALGPCSSAETNDARSETRCWCVRGRNRWVPDAATCGHLLPYFCRPCPGSTVFAPAARPRASNDITGRAGCRRSDEDGLRSPAGSVAVRDQVIVARFRAASARTRCCGTTARLSCADYHPSLVSARSSRCR